MPNHYRRGARLAAMLLLLACTATPLRAHGDAATRAWTTYLGGNAQDRITSIVQVPGSGTVVVGGWTDSPDFPPRTGTSTGTGRDAFVAIFASDGNTLAGAPFIFGGAGEDQINAVALSGQGYIYAVGTTQTANMPGFTTSGNLAGPTAAFLARFRGDGTPDWLLYLDSPGSETATGVIVSDTAVYVTGQTDSCAFLGSADTDCFGLEGFVVKVDVSGAGPDTLWSKLLKGNFDDVLTASAVSGSTVVATGWTSSRSFVEGTVQNFFQGGTQDAVAAGLNAETGQVVWVEYLGGDQDDTGAGIVAGPSGKIVVVGTVGITAQETNVFATWMDGTGHIERTERKGGSGNEVVSSAAIDASGNVYIGGRTTSTDFPYDRGFDTTPDLALPPLEGFVMVLPAQEGPGWASYVGGNFDDEVLALSILQNRLVMAGVTNSNADLVVISNYDSTLSGPADGFIVAVDTDTSPPQAGTVNDRPQNDDVLVDIPTQTSRDSISANWTGFVDSESGVDRYEWAIGRSPGAQDVVPFTPTTFSFQTSFTKPGLALSVGGTYYTTVRGINGAGLTATASSNGVRVVPVGTDGGTGDGGTNGGEDGGVDGGTNGGTDGGTNEGPEDGTVPLMGWSCTAADAGLPMLAGLLALILLARRRGSQSR